MGSTSVQDTLNGAQDSAAAADRCAGNLWKLVLVDPDDTYQSLQECMDYLLTIHQKSPFVERCSRFLYAFASKAPLENEVAAAFIEELLQHLAAQLPVLDKVIRYRGCQLLQHILSGLPNQLLLDESVAGTLREQLTDRLQDKLVAVRAEAARCISHLAGNDQVGSAVLDSMMELLGTDKSKDVRVAVVQTLPLCDSTMSVLLECTRDEHPLVRKAVVQRLKDISISLMSIKQRAEVIQHVLMDKDAAVSEAGAELLAHWLHHDCGGDPLRLLQLLDVEIYTEAASLALETLINTDTITAPSPGSAATSSSANCGAISYVEAAASNRAGSRRAVGLIGLCHLVEEQLLAPHEALLWRCLCEWLRDDAISKGLAAAATGGARAAVQAAVAAERHEVLERALPGSVDQLMQLVMRHATAGPAARFSALQLLLIAAKCVEWTDAASRDMAVPPMLQLITLDPLIEAEQAAADLSDSTDDDDDDDTSGPAAAGLELAGNGGDGLFEAAVVQLVSAVQGGGSGFITAMLDGIASLASTAGLPAKPGTEDREAGVTGCVGDSSRLLQCVTYIQLLLQQLPCGKPVEDEGSSLSFSELWQILLHLALKQGQPLIRAKAVECIALYALAASSVNPGILSSAVQVLGPLAVAGGCTATKQAAVRGLTDLALLFGPAAVDSVLRRPGAAGFQAAGVSFDDDTAADGTQGCVVAKGLLELVIEQGEVLLAEAQAPAGKAKRGSRGPAKVGASSALSATSAELLSVVAEALAKLLLHQRTWLRRYMNWMYPIAAVETVGVDVSSATPPHPGGSGDASTLKIPSDSQQHQALLLVKALALLLQLRFHPAVDSAVPMHQCLDVFLEVFTAAAREHRLQLVAACLPAARQALHVNGKQNPATMLVKRVTELLQISQSRSQQPATGCLVLMSDGQPAAFEALAMQLLHEVNSMAAVTLACGVQLTKYKPYLSSLLKLVCDLPLQPSSSQWEALQALCDRLSDSIKDTAVMKDVALVQQMLQQLAQDSGLDHAQLPSEQLEQLIANLEALSLQLPCLPESITVASSSAATPAPRTARKPAAASTLNKGAATAGRTGTRGAAGKCAAMSSSEDDSSSSSSDEEGPEVGCSNDRSESQEETVAVPADLVGDSAAVKASADKGFAAVGAARRSTGSRQPLGPSSIANT